MTLVLDKFRNLLPKIKKSPSGWISFNAPCCHHRGHSTDDRRRGGVMFSDGVVYNCFNCKYTASWQPGRGINDKFKNLCRWLGADESDIKTLVLEALKTESKEYKPESFELKPQFSKKDLPEDAMPINKWVISPELDSVAEQLEPVIAYLIDRGFDPMSNDFYWTPEAGFGDRVIIPYWYEGVIVGNTARKIRDGRPKYVSDQHPHFVFNIDNQQEENRYVFVVEGQFDALSIGGVGLLTNEINEQQARIINSLDKEVIVIPDQDKPGLMLIKQAMDRGWSVAFPTWDEDVKDAADAVRKYGKLFVLVDVIKTAQKGSIKISVAMNNLAHRLEINEKK